jgi:hypothetical protein
MLALPRHAQEGGTGVSPVFGDGVESSSLRSHNSSKDMALAGIFYQGQDVSMWRRHGRTENWSSQRDNGTFSVWSSRICPPSGGHEYMEGKSL